VWPTKAQLTKHETSVTFTCNIDCTYDVRLTRGSTLVTRKIGTAIGQNERVIPLRKRLASGPYTISVSVVAPVNVGGTVLRTKSVRVP